MMNPKTRCEYSRDFFVFIITPFAKVPRLANRDCEEAGFFKATIRSRET